MYTIFSSLDFSEPVFPLLFQPECFWDVTSPESEIGLPSQLCLISKIKSGRRPISKKSGKPQEKTVETLVRPLWCVVGSGAKAPPRAARQCRQVVNRQLQRFNKRWPVMSTHVSFSCTLKLNLNFEYQNDQKILILALIIGFVSFLCNMFYYNYTSAVSGWQQCEFSILGRFYIFHTISRPGENRIHKTPTWNDPRNICKNATFLVPGTTARV